MSEKELLTKKFKMIHMNEIGISDEEKPIIGTEGLIYCIGFILHNKEHKKAIVGHISSPKLENDFDLNKIRQEIFQFIYYGGLIGASFDLYLINSAYKNKDIDCSNTLEVLNCSGKQTHTLLDVLEENIKAIKLINIESVNKNNFFNNQVETVDSMGNISINEKHDLSNRFAFDAFTGKFVTDKVLFGKEYTIINKQINYSI